MKTKTYTKLSQVLTPFGIDAHMWLEDKDGNVLDYDDASLKNASMYGTTTIVRKEFPKHLQMEVFPYIREAQLFLLQRGLDEDFMIRTPGFCWVRALLEKRKHKNYKVKIGSLGFVQADGSVFWEYG